jgi:hypothetical protein
MIQLVPVNWIEHAYTVAPVWQPLEAYLKTYYNETSLKGYRDM